MGIKLSAAADRRRGQPMRISKEKVARIVRMHSAIRAAQGIDYVWLPSEVILRDAVTVLRRNLAPTTRYLLTSRNVRHHKLLPDSEQSRKEDRDAIASGRKVFELLAKLEKVAKDMGVGLPKWANRESTHIALFKGNLINLTDEEFLRQAGVSLMTDEEFLRQVGISPCLN